VVFHWYLASTLDEARARAALARWMAGNETVKDLDKKAKLIGITFEYFPVWYFRRRHPGGSDEILLEPAAAISVSELRKLRLPAGDLRKYDSAVDTQAHPPTVPLQTALTWLEERKIPAGEIVERALVHIPLFFFKYAYQSQSYTAVVEAGTSSVFANIFPAKAEAPYLFVGGLAAIIYLTLAVIPVVGALIDESAFGIGLMICSILGILAAPALFAVAAWVAAKV
jgi:hypothetical protein